MTTSFKPAINLLLRDFYLLIINVGNAEKMKIGSHQHACRICHPSKTHACIAKN